MPAGKESSKSAVCTFAHLKAVLCGFRCRTNARPSNGAAFGGWICFSCD